MIEALQGIGVNVTSIAWHLLNFLLLLFILSRILYRPVVKMLDERAARIRESMELAERVKEQAARAEEEFRARVEEARREAAQIREQATQNAARIVAEARAQAQAEADKILERTRAELQRERELAFSELRRQVADLVVLASERVIRQQLDAKAHRALIEDFLAEEAVSGDHTTAGAGR
jgi:F-type H+-transporting ATPase subunit b